MTHRVVPHFYLLIKSFYGDSTSESKQF